MASASLQPSKLELRRQLEIKKPEPLRIVKERANTTTGCSTPTESAISRRGSTGHIKPCGSSPDGPIRSLTVLKRRNVRGSVLDGSHEWSSSEAPMSSEDNQSAEHHNSSHGTGDPFAKTHQPSGRTISVGSFLKSELFRGSSESELNISWPQPVKVSSRNERGTVNPLIMDSWPSFKTGTPVSYQELSSLPSRRRKSLGKRLVSKAFDGLGNARSKSMRLVRSKSSKDSSLRQISLRNFDSSRQPSFEAPSKNSSAFSFVQDSALICDSRPNSVLYANEPAFLPKPSLVLYPEIAVIPEVDTVDFGDEVSLWVAVVVTGVLRKTADLSTVSDMLLTTQNFGKSKHEIMHPNIDYGYLYGVDITLGARKGCLLERVIAEQSQPRRLHLGQTELILARVKLLVCRRRSSHVRESSKELIAELESQLGNATTEYLNIGVSYKHSAFPTCRSSTVASKGLSFHATTMRIEAHAVIKRRCSESSWSCRTSNNQDSGGVPNPLFSLITAHCSPAKAARLMSKIAPDALSPAEGHRPDPDIGRHWDSSSDTITPTTMKSSKDTLHAIQLENPIRTPTSKQSLDITQAGFHDTDSNLGTLALNPYSGPDPARKIWSDMRKSSRGTGKRDSRARESLQKDGSSSGNEMDVSMQREQARILELALRNKRSLGAETLRSMAAPSTSMALGMGRGWVWGPPWW